MSFYGNHYSYLAEAFAEVVVKNLGANIYAPNKLPVNFDKVDTENASIDLEAATGTSSLEISSGNHWIELGVNKTENANTGLPNNALCISHGVPKRDETNEIETKSIIPLTIVDPESEIVKQQNFECVKLDHEQIISIPIIDYDHTGHIIQDNKNVCRYYELPKDLTKDQLDQLNATVKEIKESYGTTLDGMNSALDTIIPDLDKKVGELNSAVEGFETYMEETVQPAVNDLEDYKAQIDSDVSDISTVANRVSATQIVDSDRIKVLEDQDLNGRIEVLEGQNLDGRILNLEEAELIDKVNTLIEEVANLKQQISPSDPSIPEE